MPILPLLVACTLPHPTIPSVTADPTTVAAGDTVTITAELTDFELVTPDPAGGEDQGVNVGHIHTYWDSLDYGAFLDWHGPEPVFEQAIPAEAEPGEHVLILRLHRADHRIIEPQVTGEVGVVVE